MIFVFLVSYHKVVMYTAIGPSLFYLEEIVAPALSIDKQIADLMAKMPENPVYPALDAIGSPFVNKDVAAYDQLVSLAIMWLMEAVRQRAIDTIFNDGDCSLSIVDTRWPPITHIDSDLCLAFGPEAFGTWERKGRCFNK